MKVIAVIPARFKSTRFPGKPLADICGKPMIYWVSKQVSKANTLNGYVVATDDRLIYDACKKYDIPVVMTSDKHVNGTERVAEVAENSDADIFINVQGDEPMVDPQAIDAVADAFRKDLKLEYAQAAKEIVVPSDFVDNTVVKIAVSSDGWAVYLSRSPIPYPRTLNKFKAFKHIGIYGFTKPFLRDFIGMGESQLESIEGIEQLRAIENGRRLKIIEVQNDTVSVDTPADLEKILKYYSGHFKG